MSVNDLVLVQGMADTRRALARWNDAPWRALGPWLALSLAISGGLLLAVLVIAEVTRPDLTPYYLPGYTAPADLGDYGQVLFRNSLVLALHAMACVAGFIAGSSLPLSASKRSGLSRVVHEKAGPYAIAFVVGATTISLCTQAYVIGSAATTVSVQVHTTPVVLILTLLPHALPELVALFLPLAAWIIASRRGRWDELLAATLVTVAIAVPLLLASAAIELWVWPQLLSAVD